jgi:DNA-binding HxlR family transcriptional regulator
VKPRHCAELCPLFQAALDVLARPWNGLMMALLQEAGPLRFSELRERLDAMGDRMLSARLKELEARGLVERTVAAGPPVKVTYALTELGRGFGDVERALGR